MRGNLIWKKHLEKDSWDFEIDANGDFEIWNGGKITIYRKNTMDEKQSNQLQEKQDKGYEITAFRNDSIVYKRVDDGYYQCENPFSATTYDAAIIKYEIYSVRRTADDLIFTIGDETNYGAIGLFFISDGKMLIQQDKTIGKGFGGVPIRNLKKKEKEVLFTTEDGIKINSYDTTIFPLADWDFSYRDMTLQKYFKNYNPDAYRVFSTKENAEQYIRDHKPIFSYWDICNGLGIPMTVDAANDFAKRLNELLKRKLHQ